ncbi:MAG: hypothetical protein ACR2M0_01735 [Chloroflexia bacterium]
MAHTAHRLALALLLLLLLAPLSPGASAVPPRQDTPPRLLTDPVPDPHQPGVQWFPATGHTLRGAFLDYWTRYGGLAQFGYPLTEEFFDASDRKNEQLQVQYFERNRFEYHPENAGGPYAVLLGTLGLFFHPADPPAPRPSDPAALYFEPTGHTLSGSFKKLWQSHGGLFVHGYPITEPIQETNPTDGKSYTVQYFERSRFELHPENAGTPYEVLLGLLGTQLAQKQGYFYGWYPLYGHAADFSWISDTQRGSLGCQGCPPSVCTIFVYHLLSDQVQLVGPYRGNVSPIVLSVVFGRPATPSELSFRCKSVPGYFAESVEDNPEPLSAP